MANWTYDTGTFVSPTGERFDCDTEHGRGRMLARLDAMEGVKNEAEALLNGCFISGEHDPSWIADFELDALYAATKKLEAK